MLHVSRKCCIQSDSQVSIWDGVGRIEVLQGEGCHVSIAMFRCIVLVFVPVKAARKPNSQGASPSLSAVLSMFFALLFSMALLCTATQAVVDANPGLHTCRSFQRTVIIGGCLSLLGVRCKCKRHTLW